MPSWRKVILSGSDAALNSLNTTSITASVVSASQFTGSLFGTSSWAINVVNGGGGTPTLQQVTTQGASTTVPITASVISASQFTGSLFGTSSWAISASRAVSSSYALTASFALNGGGGGLSGDQYETVFFENANDPVGATFINTYPLYAEGWSFKVGRNAPTVTIPSGAHVLKDNRELFTNAKVAVQGEPFILLGFGQKNGVSLTATNIFEHPGIDEYAGGLIPGEIYGGSLKLRKTLYGIQDADGNTKLVADGGFIVKPSSPGFLVGQGGYYIFESASMQFNASGALISPVASASVKLGLATDSSSFTIAVGKNDLREVLFISRSGGSPRIGIGTTTPQNALTISGSLNVSSNITASRILTNNDVILSGSVLQLPNLIGGSIGDYAKLLIVDSTGLVKTLATGSVPYIEVGPGVIPVEQKLVMFTGSTGDVANAIGTSYSPTTGWNFISAGTSYDITTVNLFAANILNVNLTSSIISASGGITGSNLSINGFPNVSASLASLSTGVGTLQQVTDAGNTTNKAISSSFNGVGFFGTASWAINVVNGGGGGGGGSDSAFLTQSTAATTWSFAHNLGTQYPVITVYDTSGQVIIPQEIDGEDTNNLKIYFPTSQSGYATAVGGTSALTYYSQSLTTASVSLNTITFTKGDSSEFIITVDTGSTPTLQQVTTQGASTTVPITASIISASSFTGSLFGTSSWAQNASNTITSSFALTASYVNPLRQDVIITGSTYITGGFEALGNKGSKIQLGTYNVGYDIVPSSTVYITGSGLIISGNMPDQDHHNFLKIGNVELVDVNTAITQNEFLIHNVNTLRITSGADGGDITNTNQLLKIGSGDFYVYRAGSKNSSGIIRSTGTTTTIEDTNLTLISNNLYLNISDGNEISTLNGTDYLTIFSANPSPSPQITQKIKANKFIWATGSNQIISGGLIITGSTNSSGGFTGSLFGTSSWAANALTASYVLNAISSSFALTSSLANRNILTASVSLNTITFTKGDNTTFNITVDTGSGGGGGGGVTINNNVDNYIVTATGTANTLNGESELLYSGSTLINRGRTYFGSGSVPTNVSHTFRGYNQGDSSYFSVLDFDGNKVFNINGDAVSGSLYIDLGDTLGVGSSTTIALDDNVGSINLTGKTVTVGDVNNDGYLQYTHSDTKFSFKGSVEASLGGFTGSLQGTASLASRNILTASVNSNTITFTKGDNTTFNLTINTGSGGGGGGTPGGANTTIQFNDSSTFSGSGNFTFNKTTNAVILTGSLNISSSGTALQIVGSTGSVLLSVSGSSPNIFSISNSGSARLATFTQTLNNHGILLVGSESYQPANGSSATDGVLIVLGVNRSGNRQLWIGDSTAAGSATNGFFRYQTGTPLPSLDATSGNGVNRLNVNIATSTTNAGVGYEYGTGTATGTTLPPSRLSVNGGLTVASGSSFTASTAPVGGAIIQGNTLIGTATNSTFRLDVSGAVRLQTGLAVTGTTSMTGSLIVSTNITASRTFLSGSVGTVSGSTLTVYGSGSAQPVFTVQGSSGELFSVTDSLTGSLFSVNDISGLPILEVFSDNSVLIGSYLDPMLVSTAKVTQTNSGSFVVYSLPTASYDTAFFEYSVRSGSNARVGTIMAIQSASSVNFMETTASQFGSTSAISFTVVITGSNMALTGSSTTGSWTIKTIVRGI